MSNHDEKQMTPADGGQKRPHLRADELKRRISFTRLAEARGLKIQRSGTWRMAKCPFHPDRTPSFAIYGSDDRAKCFGCGWHGSVIDFEMKTLQCDFPTACRSLNQFLLDPKNGATRIVVAQASSETPPIPLSEEEMITRRRYVTRLATDRWLASRICDQRPSARGEAWNPDTLMRLAQEGHLGWAGDALAFLYPTGTKLRRWPHKDFLWEGSADSLWRQDRISKARTIYITESETDAIAMINAGVELADGAAVVAAPSATTWKTHWNELFRGKEVVLCFDNDEAGRAGTQAVGAQLTPYAKTVCVFDWSRIP